MLHHRLPAVKKIIPQIIWFIVLLLHLVRSYVILRTLGTLVRLETCLWNTDLVPPLLWGPCKLFIYLSTPNSPLLSLVCWMEMFICSSSDLTFADLEKNQSLYYYFLCKSELSMDSALPLPSLHPEPKHHCVIKWSYALNHCPLSCSCSHSLPLFISLLPHQLFISFLSFWSH